jgi:hypothetical protein
MPKIAIAHWEIAVTRLTCEVRSRHSPADSRIGGIGALLEPTS